jgi:hypothetical protein
LDVIKMLWTMEREDFEGRFHTLREAVANPKPIQSPSPPVWIGASGPKMLGVVARHADVWNWAGEGLDAAVKAGQELNAVCSTTSRDPQEIRWSAQFVFDGVNSAGLLDEMRQWHDAGFTELVVSCSGPDPVRSAEVAAEIVLPAMRRFG